VLVGRAIAVDMTRGTRPFPGAQICELFLL